MSDLQDFIAEESGITLHRRRVLKAFSHVPDSPLMEVLVRKSMVNYRRELHGYSDLPDADSK